MINLKTYIIAGVLGSTLIGLGYMHYTSMLKDIENLQLTNQQLRISNQSKDVTISEYSKSLNLWKQSQEETIRIMNELRDISIQSQTEVKRINDIFSKHDLSKLALAKPGLIEKRVNDATADTIRMLECASGSRDPSCSTGRDSKAEGN